MKLDTYIFKAILSYPSLYYKGNFEWSKTSILNQTFLTIGNGIEYKKEGVFGSWSSEDHYKMPLKKGFRGRILAGERLVTIYSKINPDWLKSFGRVYGDINSKKTVMFWDDFIKKYKEYTVSGAKVDKPVGPIVDIYPCSKEYEWKPYPFSIEYCPFWNRETKSLVDKDFIQKDWREGIIWIFKKTLAWFEDDNKWGNNNYFNWGGFWESNGKKYEVDHFLNNWNKHKDKRLVCKDYAIPPKDYTDPKELAVDISKHQRQNYIDVAKKIIAHYESNYKISCLGY